MKVVSCPLRPDPAGAGSYGCAGQAGPFLPEGDGWIDCRDARLTLWASACRTASLKKSLTWRFTVRVQADIFPMTHHVECVAILEPVK